MRDVRVAYYCRRSVYQCIFRSHPLTLCVVCTCVYCMCMFPCKQNARVQQRAWMEKEELFSPLIDFALDGCPKLMVCVCVCVAVFVPIC